MKFLLDSGLEVEWKVRCSICGHRVKVVQYGRCLMIDPNHTHSTFLIEEWVNGVLKRTFPSRGIAKTKTRSRPKIRPKLMGK